MRLDVANKEAVRAALQAIADANKGVLLPNDVIEEARSENSVLHNLFVWDDVEAGDAFRIEQARKIIAGVRIEFRTEKQVLSVHAYVRDPRQAPGEQGYASVVSLRSKTEDARAALDVELARIQSAVERARALARVWGLGDDLKEFLREL